MSLEFKWQTQFTAGEVKETPFGPSLMIEGVFIDTSVNKNRWALDEGELDSVANQLPGIQLRIDHSRSVRDIVGGFTEGVKEEQRVLFKGEIDDPDIIRKVVKKRIGFVSPGLKAQSFCSACNKPTRPIKNCKCEEYHEVIKNVKVKEGSIIGDPAFETTSFKPRGFVASVEEALSQDNKDDKVSGDVSATVKVVNKQLEEKREMAVDNKSDKEEIKEEEAIKKNEASKLSERIDSMESKVDEIVNKLEELTKKVCPDEDEEEDKKEETKEDPIKPFIDKLDEFMKKLAEPRGKQEDKQEETKEEDKEEDKKEEKEAKADGAQVDTREDSEASETSVTGKEKPKWWEEIVAAAKEHGVLD